MDITSRPKDYNIGFLDGLLQAISLVELQRETEVFLGGIDEANGIYQAKRQLLKYLENVLAEHKNLGYDPITISGNERHKES